VLPVAAVRQRGRIDIQPRFKIQYPMKNHYIDATKDAKRCIPAEKNIITG